MGFIVTTRAFKRGELAIEEADKTMLGKQEMTHSVEKMVRRNDGVRFVRQSGHIVGYAFQHRSVCRATKCDLPFPGSLSSCAKIRFFLLCFFACSVLSLCLSALYPIAPMLSDRVRIMVRAATRKKESEVES